jgi:hypothetical protein
MGVTDVKQTSIEAFSTRTTPSSSHLVAIVLAVKTQRSEWAA